jgi:hypothetical protein
MTSHHSVMTKVLHQLESWQKSNDETACLQIFRTTNYEYQKVFNPDKEDGTCSWCVQSPIPPLASQRLVLFVVDYSRSRLWQICALQDLVDKRLFGLEPSDTILCYFFLRGYITRDSESYPCSGCLVASGPEIQ